MRLIDRTIKDLDHKKPTEVHLEIFNHFDMDQWEDVGWAPNTNSSLEKLHLTSSWIGDEGLVLIGEWLCTNTNLMYLDISTCRISDVGHYVIHDALEANLNTLEDIRMSRTI